MTETPKTESTHQALIDALAPFSHAIDALDLIREGKPGEKPQEDDKPIFVTWGSKGSGKDAAITFGDLRRARAAIARATSSEPSA